MSILEVNARYLETDGILICRIFVSDVHHTDPSRSFMKPHEVSTEIPGRG